MYREIMKKLTPLLVAVVSVVAIILILLIRGGVSDGVRYKTSDSFYILGCELGADVTNNELYIQSIKNKKTSELLVTRNVQSVCGISSSEVESFEVGFYKQYLISLVVDGESILSKEDGVQAYKASTSMFVLGIIFFNIVGGVLVLISNSVRKEY